MKNKLIKKFLSFSLGGYINAIIGFFTIPLITRMLSPDQFGIASLVTVLVEIFIIICSLGMEQGFIRYFYEEKKESISNLLYNCLYYPFFMISITFLMIFIFREKISIFILNKTDKDFWIVLVLIIFFRLIGNFSFTVIRMQQKGWLYSFFTILLKVLEFIFLIIFYNIYKNNYKTLIFSILLSSVISTILSILMSREAWGFKNKIQSKVSKKELLYFSSPLALTLALSWIFASSDKILIKYFSNLTEVGLYSGAFKVVSIISVVQNGFTTFWTPVVYEHYSKNPDDLSFFRKANEYLSLIFFMMGIGVIFCRNIIIFIFGEKYYSSIFIMPMLVFIPVMYLLSETTVMGIGFKKKSKYFLYTSILVATINLIGNIILVPLFGAKGAAISTGISYILFFSFRTYFSNKLIDFGFKLKKMYFIIFLMLLYALILSFYSNIYFTILAGLVLEIIILLVYKSILSEIYKKIKSLLKNIV